MLFHMSLFIFRQKKLEKVMEEEGLKDEEVINIEKIFLETQRGRSYLIQQVVSLGAQGNGFDAITGNYEGWCTSGFRYSCRGRS